MTAPAQSPWLSPLLACSAAVAIALPFLYGHTTPPLSNFWPLAVSGLCAFAVAAALAAAWSRQPAGAAGDGLRQGAARTVAAGMLLAGLLGAAIGLAQFFWGDPGWAPWIYPSTHGVAMGNLRQRNQQATLLCMGAWALAWWVARTHQAPQVGEGRRLRPASVALALLAFWALALLAAGAAATASRTGALEWGCMLVLLLLWRRSLGAPALALGMAGIALYALFSGLLPILLERWTGFAMDGLFARLSAPEHACDNRRVLWSNVLHLIAQRPWTGWGWGELSYAHYITQYPGKRFCLLVDNAHDLPLHLAVELGLPFTLAACGLALWLVWRARPWRETDPARQLAWGLLAIIGVHSLLEFPLWYGPFQLAAACALALLWPRCWRTPARAALRVPLLCGAGLAAGLWLAGIALLVRDYHRVSQLYIAVDQRDPAFRDDTARRVADSTVFFRDTLDFAVLTTLQPTRHNAARVHALASRLLHYSPEPRVIEALIDSATRLGLDGEADFHARRYRDVYPQEYASWLAKRPAPAATVQPATSPSGPRPGLLGPRPSRPLR
ncbi:Wzy polymerase domain-containing protein [Acidovorax sp. NCPPB 3859]|nr:MULTISPECIES: Wzy polymerase domain-containing protein [unclassified Acidovorax]MDA8450155.1 Wzy polymerase domain-containing protein [Acidovorax sp. GBBC 3297]MDA8459500.1 Wzy polymerase domain-containing protein [Acidovorax sp. GBBC 3333]MDA8464636.1 Wzy polymerase domain-containing protein [Acidovorax sp. GBBC 3332]MDA8469570.1 Wzy polymerase domain-containing protein [Acidovorax sp. GBBC 3299]WCM79458.1 Wzy polymerase domain-containing protein [Acidovorax sp. GBBC 712]